jgi:lipopolysaccharide transport system ATP-binding protein
MARIIFDQVYLDIPVVNGPSRRTVARRFANSPGDRIEKLPSGRLLVHALRPISFELNPGDRLGISGPNGAGKSTLLRLMAGIYEPTGGRIIREGNLATLLDPQLGVQPDATGRQSIYFRAGLLGLSRAQTNALLDDIVDFAGIGSFLDMPVRGYSDGMRLRLTFALITAAEFDLLVMDEWLSVADVGFQSRALARLRERLGNQGVAAMASHNADLLDQFATDRLLLG